MPRREAPRTRTSSRPCRRRGGAARTREIVASAVEGSPAGVGADVLNLAHPEDSDLFPPSLPLPKFYFCCSRCFPTYRLSRKVVYKSRSRATAHDPALDLTA